MVAAVAVGSILLIALILLLLVGASVVFLLSPAARRGTVTVEGSARRVDAAALAPFTEAEIAALDGAAIWVVQYRDEFSFSEDRDSYERYAYPVAICFSAEDAEAEARRRGEPFKPGWAGFDAYGPVAPRKEFRDDGHPDNALRAILARLAEGSREPIS
ncbi:MAG: hypothetical protein ACREUO_09430, partial [Burkholderiales bacterium]